MADIKTRLATADEVRQRAGLKSNTNISDAEIQSIIDRVHMRIISNISSRYDLKSFTDERFVETSPAYGHIKELEIILSSDRLMTGNYGPQAYGEDYNAFDEQETEREELRAIRDGMVRMLDYNLDEFGLLPKYPNSNATAPSQGINTDPAHFKRNEKW